MDNLFALQAPLVALTAGLFYSLHCVGMCGPIACSALIGLGKGRQASSASMSLVAIYAAGRLLSYAAVGALAGAIGAGLISFMDTTPARVLPWLFIAFFIAALLGWEKSLTRKLALGSLGRSITQQAYSLQGWQRALALGLATPLLPCGPLYLIVWACAGAGSAAGGAMIMALFCIGTFPLLSGSVLGWRWLGNRLSPQTFRRAQYAIALLAFALIFSRSLIQFDESGSFSLCF